jgi:uncharacterized protein (TIGR03067 family)
MKKTVLTLSVVLSLTGFAFADDAEKDLKKLVGTWQTVSHTADGKETPADMNKGSTVIIDASGKWQALKDGTVVLKGTVKLDPSKSPKAADWSVDDTDIVAKGIYEVDGDNWKHCFSLTERPKAFESKDGSGATNVVLKRIKK